MSSDFKLDLGRLRRLMNISPRAAGRGATKVMNDVKDDWIQGARDVAPLDKRNLRDQIHGNVRDPGMDAYVEIEANATQDTGGKRFNYAYYIHEKDAGGKSLKTPGTEKKFLEVSAEKRKADYKRWLEEDIKAELRKAGW